MKVDSLIALAVQRLKTVRKYSSQDSRPEFELKRYAEHLAEDDNCLGHFPVISGNTFQATDMCLLGPGTQNELGTEWGLPLPGDYLDFCSRFDDYLFAGGSFLVVNNAADIRDSVTASRQVLDIDPDSKHRLFHFASVIGLPGYFTFRWSADYAKMDVAFVWDHGDVSYDDLLGEPGDRFSSDPDFSSWLERMIATDGVPLFPGGQWPMADGGVFEDEETYCQRLS